MTDTRHLTDEEFQAHMRRKHGAEEVEPPPAETHLERALSAATLREAMDDLHQQATAERVRNWFDDLPPVPRMLDERKG